METKPLAWLIKYKDGKTKAVTDFNEYLNDSNKSNITCVTPLGIIHEKQLDPLLEIIEWIPVSDKLPDDEITVLVNHPDLDEPVWLGYLCDMHWHTVAGECIDNGRVTHWAHIPAGIEDYSHA